MSRFENCGFSDSVMTDRDKALKRLKSRTAHTAWHNTGWFDVPGAVMRQLVADGFAEMRKINGHSPTEYRATYKAY